MTKDGLTANGAIIYADTEADPAADRFAVGRGDNQTTIIGAASNEGQRT